MSDDFELKFEMGAYAARSVYSLAKENHELLKEIDRLRLEVKRYREMWDTLPTATKVIARSLPGEKGQGQ